LTGADAIRRRVLIRGRVQGVFFRGSTERQAQRVGVAGWVRNCSDGSVEAAFEGPRADVEELLAFCRRGPAAARVASVEVVEETPRGEAGFSVRR
jgi:acylphosphatase